MKLRLTLATLGTACGLAAVSTGLAQAAEATVPPAEAKAKLEAARAEIAAVRSNIVLTLEELDRVRSATDQQAQFQRFSTQLTNTEAQAKLVAERARAMKQRGSAYFADWEARTAAIQDPQTKRWAQERYAARKQSYDRMVKQMQQARADFLPLVSELRQIQTLLSANRDAASIAAAKEHFTRANWYCVDVQRSLMQVETEFSFLAAEFALHEK